MTVHVAFMQLKTFHIMSGIYRVIDLDAVNTAASQGRAYACCSYSILHSHPKMEWARWLTENGDLISLQIHPWQMVTSFHQLVVPCINDDSRLQPCDTSSLFGGIAASQQLLRLVQGFKFVKRTSKIYFPGQQVSSERPPRSTLLESTRRE